ncbi:glycosyltransferase [Phenylobacterium terrae]|uniref:UDP-N-acetylglucosamine--N-acetylmuramyl-(pentapeptide) pyrophosphoryl-undecaprenol N-acetylglucosamine transferase n=1 Tax=Phenylobacterium terrae TaxID=2665495 RepID=A0ABW4MZN0_9CAUL
MRQKAVALGAGGTGGHLFPAQALASELCRRGWQVTLLTDDRGAAFAGQASRDTVALPASRIGGGVSGKARAAAVIASATWKARRLLRERQARGLVGFGGYPSFAPALAAKSLGLPLLLHEQATKFSLANQKLLGAATRVALSFPIEHGRRDADKFVLTGPPVRPEIAAAAGAPFPTLDGSIRLLVVGGSQAAAVFGEQIPRAVLQLPDDLRARLRLALQYRGDDAEDVRARLEANGVATTVAPFFHDMADQLVAAHLVICRAGASTAADLTAVGRPAIFIPIPRGGSADEQDRNARAFERAGAGWRLAQVDLEAGLLAPLLRALLSGDALAEAAAASAKLGRADGAARLADLVEQTLA